MASLLTDTTASAVALLRAARAAIPDVVSFEPESIWLELQHQGIDVPVENRARLMAAITLLLVPSFYWDATAYEKTALALDGVQINPDILEEASPAQLAWAVVEAAWIIKDNKGATWEMGHEPRAYTGVILQRAGFVLAPEQLEFAQTALNRERFHHHLLEEVTERWNRVDKNGLEKLVLEETPVDVQIARLAAVALHVAAKRASVERDFARLA